MCPILQEILILLRQNVLSGCEIKFTLVTIESFSGLLNVIHHRFLELTFKRKSIYPLMLLDGVQHLLESFLGDEIFLEHIINVPVFFINGIDAKACVFVKVDLVLFDLIWMH